MIKIGITGSLASGKTTASQILSNGRGPLFSADRVVKDLYKDTKFKKLLSKKFNIKNDNFIKNNIKKIILGDKKNIKKLEKIIHPQVRINMKKFTNKNKDKKILFYEIPLLIESKLMKYSKLAHSLKLIPITAENSSGFDYEMKKPAIDGTVSDFPNKIKVILHELDQLQY